MRIASYGNFQKGIVDDPSVEDQGGFEFASGMDIFSELGVLKACAAMEEVTYGAGAAPTAIPSWADDTQNGANNYLYATAGDKLLESVNGGAFNLFLTNANGNNLGLKIFDTYVYYADDAAIGRAPVGNGAAKNDSYSATAGDTEFRPMLVQGGTLKIGSSRYISSIAEGGTVTAQAFKVPINYRIKCLADHFTRLFMGTRIGTGTLASIIPDATVFDWRGILLATGAALPDSVYPVKLRAMSALLSDGGDLYAFPDSLRNIHIFDGATFKLFRRLNSDFFTPLAANPGAVTQHQDTILYSGEFTAGAGVFQMKSGAICQAFVPAGITPGATASINIGFVKSSFNGVVYLGYYKASDNSYHIEKSGSNKQNNAVIRTLWHRMGTDKFKRQIGVKLNLKPMAASTAVTVKYRTARGASFTSAPYTVTSANQDKPVFFTAQPRDREIQYEFTFTTATTNTPELLSYDPLYEVLNASR